MLNHRTGTLKKRWMGVGVLKMVSLIEMCYSDNSKYYLRKEKEDISTD